MAPTSPLKRVTRARAAAKSSTDDAAPKKLGTAKVTKPATSKTTATKATTRKTRTVKDEAEEEIIEPEPAKKTTRTTKTAAPLAAAPRRRIKVTPLDPPIAEEPVPEPEPEKPKRKASTRPKKAVEPEAAVEEEPEPAPTRSRTTKTTTTKSTATKKPASKAVEPAATVPKTRGRPKKAAEPEDTSAPEPEPVKTTRQTRARSASNASQQPAEIIQVAPKPKTTTRKKVTFQDVIEDEKENEPVAPRRAGTKKESTGPATGIRAKPVRKPAASTTKKAPATRTRAAKAVESRALTPRKVTQVQRVATPDGSEDELTGAKTPVRDLSLSPKRNPNLAAQLSPAKKLNFTQTLNATSLDKPSESAGLMSPARRPTSPAKNTVSHISPVSRSPMKDSPRRADIFNSAAEETAAPALVPNTNQGLLQSPKRGVLDASIFSHSAMKPKRSPLKESLLQSPARRLFSPAKQKTPLGVHRDDENDTSMHDTVTVEEVAVSSHFRPSMSPQRAGRVHRMSDEELADELAMDMDFDQSVLKLTSPRKSPAKAFKPVADVLDKELIMPTFQNDVEETAKAVEELQASDDATEVETDDEEPEQEETVEPAQMSISATDDPAEEKDAEDTVVQAPPKGRGKATRLSQVLFRSNRSQDEEEESEDGLAADQTPVQAPRHFRSSLTGNNARSRLSMGVPLSANRNVGFTPLAAQMSGWLANSPERSPNKVTKRTPSRGLFSPVAAQHIAGEIQISRQSTPQQQKSSPGFRQSVTSRPSLTPSALGSPEKSSFFAEQMSSMEEAASADVTAVDDMEGIDMAADDLTTNNVIAAENAALLAELEHVEEPSVAEADETEEDTVIVNKTPDELTTDLVNEVHASDTAMVEFQQLASEAEIMAEVEADDDASSSEYGDENAAPEQTLNLSVMERDATPEEQTLDLHVMEQRATPHEDPTLNLHVLEQNAVDEEDDMSTPTAPSVMAADDRTLNLHVLEEAGSTESLSATPVARCYVAADEPTLNLHVLEESAASRSASATPSAKLTGAVDEPTLNLHVLEQNVAATPAVQPRVDMDEATLNLHVLEQNMPEAPGAVRGHGSSFSPDGSPAPTVSPTRAVPVPESDEIETPVGRSFAGVQRFANTVVSKVPLKPECNISPIKMPKKRSRSMSMSGQQSPPKRPQMTPLGKVAARSTSYPVGSPSRSIRSAVPSPAHTTPGQMSFALSDFGDSTLDGIELPDDEMDFDIGRPAETPVTVKSTRTAKSVAATPARTPLKAVGDGVLHGAVIYVEVHTSEGADASEVYIDLLSQMGAKCVRDWRWNPRASVHGGDDLAAASKIGVTHVVYKDGGKRTLEKVRDAKGEVWCVGVRWVLDCERENKWLDETPYLVDHGILPRGGSRRRKSMEPKALMNANGSIRAGRRSTSAEFMTSQMREELVNTPVRTYQPPAVVSAATAPREGIVGVEDSLVADSDISSTYNSPTTTMNIRHVDTPTALVGWDPATSKTPAKANGAGAGGSMMTMMDTPYLMKQGGMVLEHAREGGAMSAPPKQINRGLFDGEAEFEGENGNRNGEGEEGKGSKKGEKMKLKLIEARRRTMGWKPVVGSPLGKF